MGSCLKINAEVEATIAPTAIPHPAIWIRFSRVRSRSAWSICIKPRDEEIDLSDRPEITPEMFANAVVRRGEPKPKMKIDVTLPIDSDFLEWFKSQYRGDRLLKE
jgi:uncharacterized protein (DUF4415 family)